MFAPKEVRRVAGEQLIDIAAMEKDSTTLQEPLLEKDVEKQSVDELVDEVEEPLLEAPAPTDAQHSNEPDDGGNTSFVFTMASELAEMANLAWPLAVSFFCRMGMASTDSAFVGHIPG